MNRTLFSVAAVLVAGALAAGTIARETKSTVAIGATAPTFALPDQDGKTVKLDEFNGKIVVLEWFNNECPYVQKHYKQGNMNALAKKYIGQDTYPWRSPGEVRVIYKVAIDKVQTMG